MALALKDVFDKWAPYNQPFGDGATYSETTVHTGSGWDWGNILLVRLGFQAVSAVDVSRECSLDLGPYV